MSVAHIIPFPPGAQDAPLVTLTVTKKGGAEAVPDFPVVRPIRKGLRVPRKPRAEDEKTAMIARISASYAEKAAKLGQTDPDSSDHRLALHMQGIGYKLPCNNLRCIVSTLDEQRDFDLRCAELELLRAEHDVVSRRVDRLRVIEGAPWWESPTQKPMVDANNRLWSVYRDRVAEFAMTPARTDPQLERKRRVIGKAWLEASSDEWYEGLRAGVKADEEWLAANRPKRGRRS